MSNEMFSDEQTQVVAPAPITLEKLPDEVAGLIGEGKKYATLEVALKALGPSQQFIEQLKEENRVLREKGEQGHSIEEVFNAVKERLEQERPQGVAGLDEASVASLIDSRLSVVEQKRQKDANEARFKSTLAETFGEKAGEVFNKTAEELGYSRAEFSEFARTKPEAALKLLGVEKKATLPKQVQSGVNTEVFNQRQNEPPVRKSVMFGSTTAEVTQAWRDAAPKPE